MSQVVVAGEDEAVARIVRGVVQRFGVGEAGGPDKAEAEQANAGNGKKPADDRRLNGDRVAVNRSVCRFHAASLS